MLKSMLAIFFVFNFSPNNNQATIVAKAITPTLLIGKTTEPSQPIFNAPNKVTIEKKFGIPSNIPANQLLLSNPFL